MSRNDIQKITADLSQLPEPFAGHAANRVETGALEINDDWPGVFIRGDNAMHYAITVRQVLAVLDAQDPEYKQVDMFVRGALKSLQSLLASSRI